MDEYDPDSLANNTRRFDQYPEKYAQVYTQAGISVKRFANVDEFVANYLKKNQPAVNPVYLTDSTSRLGGGGCAISAKKPKNCPDIL